eukprot:11847290-Heterocapsa_arctica.AAC.1
MGSHPSNLSEFTNVELDSAPKITVLAFVHHSPSSKVLGRVPDLLIVRDDFNDILRLLMDSNQGSDLSPIRSLLLSQQ